MVTAELSENEVKRKVKSTHNVMKKNVLTFFNEPTKKVIPASEVSKNI